MGSVSGESTDTTFITQRFMSFKAAANLQYGQFTGAQKGNKISTVTGQI